VFILQDPKLNQWFSTFSLKGAKSRLTTLLENPTKDILTQVSWQVLFYSRTNCVTQKYYRFYWKTAEGRTKSTWEPHVAPRTAVENHWFKSN